MGKETDLLKAVRDGDMAKVQKLLSATVKRQNSESLCWQSGDTGDKIRVELRHINIDVVEPKTGNTPLLLAVLNGSKAIAERLIYNCADITARDVKGNTCLHFAAFISRLDFIEMLLFNDAQVNAENMDGNTALHIACQSKNENSSMIIKRLVEAGTNVWIKNKYNYIALDVAALYSQNDVLTELLENAPTLKNNKTAIVEAAIRGFLKAVEILLENGIDPNHIDENNGTFALHEAVRYSRYDVVRILISFGARLDLSNLKKETPMSIVESLPPGATVKMKELLKESENISPRYPKTLRELDPLQNSSKTESKKSFLHIKDINSLELGTDNVRYAHIVNLVPHYDYPALPTDITWTQNRPKFCSSCTEKNPNTQLLDENPRTFWVIPVLHNAWVILDLHVEHIVTGITVWGWTSPQMLKTFQLQISDSMEGPWSTVSAHTCESLGSTDPKEKAFPQKFGDFTFQSRYIRLYLIDNHGGSYICFQGIELHGVDCRVIDTLQTAGLYSLADDFVALNLNTWKTFLDMSLDLLDEKIENKEKKASLLEMIYKGRKQMYPFKTLKWVTPPATMAYIDEPLPEFSVQSDPGVTEVLQVIVQGAQVKGNACCRLESQGDRKASIGKFTDIVLTPEGLYSIIVKGVTSDAMLVAPMSTEVRPKVKSSDEISSAFDEIQSMLNEVQASLGD